MSLNHSFSYKLLLIILICILIFINYFSLINSKYIYCLYIFFLISYGNDFRYQVVVFCSPSYITAFWKEWNPCVIRGASAYNSLNNNNNRKKVYYMGALFTLLKWIIAQNGVIRSLLIQKHRILIPEPNATNETFWKCLKIQKCKLVIFH